MKRFTLTVVLVVYVVLLWSCKKDEFKNLDCSKIDSKYSTSIKAILDASCNTSGCHNGSSGQINLSSYTLLKPYLDNGKFNEVVIVNKSMPKGKSLSQDQRDKIKCWLDSGAPNN